MLKINTQRKKENFIRKTAAFLMCYGILILDSNGLHSRQNLRE
jgi:hypothetical protein